MTARPVPLLARHSKTAPRFDPSKPLSLWDYFWDYEILSEAAQLDEATKIKKSIIYLTRDDADFWESLDEYTAANDWQAFKKAVLSFYPGSIPKERWTLCNLDELCKAQKTKQVNTRGDFAEFTRAFTVISFSLISQELLSDLEARKLYWNVLDQDFKEKLIRKVELTKPAYTLRTILTIEEIRHAAGLVLDGTVADTSTEVSKSTEKATLVTSLELAKLEPFDTEQFAQIIAAMIVQTVQTAITMALDQVNSMNVPSLQTNITHRNYPGASCPASVKEERPADLRDGPKAQEIDDLGDRFSSSATVASSNTNDTQTSSDLVKAESSEIDIEQQEGLDTYIAALQKFNLHGGENDEGLEDVIRVLKARINKKKRTNGTSYQGPQEKRTDVLLKSTPFSPILEAAEQDGLPTLREPLVEPLLTLSPESRRQFKEAATGRRVENVKEEVETASTVAAYLVGGAYSSKFGVFSRLQQAHTTLSEPIEALSSVLLVEVSLEKGDAAVEARKQQKGELADEKGEVSHRPRVVELFEEKECFPLSPHVMDPPRNEKSFMYLPSPHVQSLKVSPSMYSIAPPVPVCYSAVTNSSRIVCAGPSIVNTSEWGSERKKSRPRAVKKIERLLYDPGGEGLVQFRTSMLAKAACAYLGTPFDEEPVYAQNRDCATPRARMILSSKVQRSLQLRLQRINLSHLAQQFRLDMRRTSIVERPYPIPALHSLFQGKRSHESEAYRDPIMKKLQRVSKKKAPLPLESRNGELTQLEAFRTDVPISAYLETLPKEESRVRIQNLESMSSPSFMNPHACLVELLTRSAATFLIDESSFISASHWKAETKTLCQWTLKNVQLLDKAGSKVSVQLETFWVLACAYLVPYLVQPINGEVSAHLQNPGTAYPLEFKSRRVFVIKLSTFISAVFIPDEKTAHCRKPAHIIPSSLFDFRCFISILYPSSRPFYKLDDCRNDAILEHKTVVKPFLVEVGSEKEKSRQAVVKEIALLSHNYENEGLVQLGASRIAVPAGAYLEMPLNEEPTISTQPQDSITTLAIRHDTYVEISGAVAEKSRVNEPAIVSVVVPIKYEKMTLQERIVSKNVLNKTGTTHRYLTIPSVYSPMRGLYPLSFASKSLQAGQHVIRLKALRTTRKHARRYRSSESQESVACEHGVGWERQILSHTHRTGKERDCKMKSLYRGTTVVRSRSKRRSLQSTPHATRGISGPYSNAT